MTSFLDSPRTLKGGVVLIGPDFGAVLRTIVFQHNPYTLSPTLQAHGMGTTANRSEALRLNELLIKTVTLDLPGGTTE